MSRRSTRSRSRLRFSEVRIERTSARVGIVSPSITFDVTRMPSGSRPEKAPPTSSSASGLRSPGPYVGARSSSVMPASTAARTVATASACATEPYTPPIPPPPKLSALTAPRRPNDRVSITSPLPYIPPRSERSAQEKPFSPPGTDNLSARVRCQAPGRGGCCACNFRSGRGQDAPKKNVFPASWEWLGQSEPKPMQADRSSWTAWSTCSAGSPPFRAQAATRGHARRPCWTSSPTSACTRSETAPGPRRGATGTTCIAASPRRRPGEPLFFCAHLDTVPPTASAPARRRRRSDPEREPLDRRRRQQGRRGGDAGRDPCRRAQSGCLTPASSSCSRSARSRVWSDRPRSHRRSCTRAADSSSITPGRSAATWPRRPPASWCVRACAGARRTPRSRRRTA